MALKQGAIPATCLRAFDLQLIKSRARIARPGLPACVPATLIIPRKMLGFHRNTRGERTVQE